MTHANLPENLNDLYPLGEKRPDLVRARRGHTLGDLTLEGLQSGDLTASDFRITAEGLRLQAAVAEQAGRPHLAHNLRRAAELTEIPEDVLLHVYEQLRPGRAQSADDLRATAAQLRETYAATETAALLEEAALVYERRGLFQRRY